MLEGVATTTSSCRCEHLIVFHFVHPFFYKGDIIICIFVFQFIRVAMSQFEAYMPQQRSAIDYMVCRCHNREGLIVYHGMGSGKSVIGAGLVVNMKMPWVLLAPKSLHNQWQEDYVNHFQMMKPSHKIELCSDNATSLLNVLANPAYADTFAESLIIVDEAHNLSRCLETLTPEKRKLAYTSLWRFKRRILMTGTPVYWSLRDLCVLTNVAHGRQTFPIDTVEFDKQYYKVDRFRSVVEGWIAPIGKFLSTIAIFAYTAGSTAISTQNVETVMENKLLRILVEKMSQYADLLGLLARKTDAFCKCSGIIRGQMNTPIVYTTQLIEHVSNMSHKHYLTPSLFF